MQQRGTVINGGREEGRMDGRKEGVLTHVIFCARESSDIRHAQHYSNKSKFNTRLN